MGRGEEKKKKKKTKILSNAGYSRVDKFDGLRLELVGRVEVSQDEDISGVLCTQVDTESLLAHHLQPFQRVL